MLDVNPKTVAELLGANLRRHREECQYTIDQLARKSGVRWDILQGAEDGTRMLLLPEVVRLAEVLAIEPGDLFAGWRTTIADRRPLKANACYPVAPEGSA